MIAKYKVEKFSYCSSYTIRYLAAFVRKKLTQYDVCTDKFWKTGHLYWKEIPSPHHLMPFCLRMINRWKFYQARRAFLFTQEQSLACA